MTRQQVLLAILAASQGRPFTPVQIQKAVFLVTRNLPDLVDRGPNFEFVRYDDGPFDQAVYSEAESLARLGDVEITQRQGASWSQDAVLDEGVVRGSKLLDEMRQNQSEYVRPRTGNTCTGNTYR